MFDTKQQVKLVFAFSIVLAVVGLWGTLHKSTSADMRLVSMMMIAYAATLVIPTGWYLASFHIHD